MGEEITMTATPNSGYRFKEWQIVSGSVAISGDMFTMPADNVTVKAIFEKKVKRQFRRRYDLLHTDP